MHGSMDRWKVLWWLVDGEMEMAALGEYRRDLTGNPGCGACCRGGQFSASSGAGAPAWAAGSAERGGATSGAVGGGCAAAGGGGR